MGFWGLTMDHFSNVGQYHLFGGVSQQMVIPCITDLLSNPHKAPFGGHQIYLGSHDPPILVLRWFMNIHGHMTMDGRNPAPPNKASNVDSPVSTKAYINIGSSWLQSGA